MGRAETASRLLRISRLPIRGVHVCTLHNLSLPRFRKPRITPHKRRTIRLCEGILADASKIYQYCVQAIAIESCQPESMAVPGLLVYHDLNRNEQTQCGSCTTGVIEYRGRLLPECRLTRIRGTIIGPKGREGREGDACEESAPADSARQNKGTDATDVVAYGSGAT